MASLPCNCPLKSLAGTEGRLGDALQEGDIVVVTASLFDPFYAALGTRKPLDTFRRTNGSTIIGTRYSAAGSLLSPTVNGAGASTIYDDCPDLADTPRSGKRRPAIILERSGDSHGHVEMSVCLMGTFDGVSATDIGDVFQGYITHIYTESMPDKKVGHIHSTPEWQGPSREQWVIPMAYMVTQHSTPPRWKVRRDGGGDTALAEEGYYIHKAALFRLRALERKTTASFDSAVAHNKSGQRSMFVDKLDSEYRRRHPTFRTGRRNQAKRAVPTHTKRFSISHPTPTAISAY
ncbi:hypothetical protein BD626DRAFT_478044 [Schizophyllum amplum]|uniref:Uncharacterized protein n=1 Tax=Schizophyllum amplum TaxID=97359 RepID=A0A550D0R1_9AGAR|nr:hypothetical protein BD626DRAFT_478044 [Auriculariopsis ampla]